MSSFLFFHLSVEVEEEVVVEEREVAAGFDGDGFMEQMRARLDAATTAYLRRQEEVALWGERMRAQDEERRQVELRRQQERWNAETSAMLRRQQEITLQTERAIEQDKERRRNEFMRQTQASLDRLFAPPPAPKWRSLSRCSGCGHFLTSDLYCPCGRTSPACSPER